MWNEYIKSISDDFEFTQAASEQALEKTEAILGITLPIELREMLKETNGVEQRSAYLLFILSVERIEKDNLDMRHSQALKDCYMPFNFSFR